MAITPSEPIQQSENNSPDWIPPYTQLALEYPYTPHTPAPSAPLESEIDQTTSEPLFNVDTHTFGPQNDNGLKYLQGVINVGGYVVGGVLFNKFGKFLGNVSRVGKSWFVTKDETAAPPMAKQGKALAKVPKTTVNRKKKGGASTSVMPVYGRPPQVNAPVAISRRVNVQSKPVLSSNGKGLVITHREMIGQVITPSTGTDFNAVSFVCNPGRFSTFPWLSSIAGNFDKYVMKKLRFTTLSNQPTATGGRVGIAFDVDSTDPLPADRNEFFAMTYHAECSPWDTVVLDIPMDGKERFINSHTLSDSKLIDLGQVVFVSDAVSNVSGPLNSTAISDVVVEYTVELRDPQQAIYSTQVFYGKNSGVATLDLLPTAGPLVVTPSNVSPYVSTSTVFYGKVLQGYYTGSLYVGDAGGGSPTLALAVHGATGMQNSSLVVGTATYSILFKFKVTSNDGVVRVTIGAVALSALERLIFTFSRVSATVYTAMSVSDYDTSITTF